MLGTSGIDMLSLENNHSADCELFDTTSREENLAFWEENNLKLIQSQTQPGGKRDRRHQFCFPGI